MNLEAHSSFGKKITGPRDMYIDYKVNGKMAMSSGKVWLTP